MAKAVSLLNSVPDAYGILFTRPILLMLSVAAFAVYAATLSIYVTQIASTAALTPPHHSPLIVNEVSLIPSAISAIFSIVHLFLVARRLLHARRRNNNSLSMSHKRRTVWDAGSHVVHPGWLLAIDGVCWALFLATAVLSGVEANKWKNGKVEYGSQGTRQVALSACPTLDPTTGKLDYWCEQAWNNVVSLTNSGTSILGTLAGIHFTRTLFACHELYLLRRYRRVGGPCCKHSTDKDSAACPPDETREVELERN